jgi:2-keto-4-pentenoate hydratase/2-oxohepta-3-ene-1,7-dioic acid hydratase in catechol pathway
VSDNKDVEYPSFSNHIAYEVELVIKIGREGKNIKKQNAKEYISELAIGIDYTAKDILNTAREAKWAWDFAKGFDGAAPISKFQAISNFPDLDDINFDLKINGEQKQVGNTSFMITDFAEIITYISQYMTLKQGDLIFTGTPADGIGPIFKGDHLQASIEKDLLLDFKMI